MPFDTFVLGTSPGSGVGGGSTQDLWETIAADAGSEIATSPTETLTVAGGVGITTSVAGTTLTITNSSPNVAQNLWETITADSGSTLASTPTDSLSVVGGTDISTVLVGDVLTINFTGTSGGGGGGTEDAYSHIHDNVGGIASAIGHDVVTFIGTGGITITAVNGAAGDDEIFFDGGGGTDELVKVSANDTTAGFLNGKLVAGAGVSLVENNDGGDETLTVSSDVGGGSFQLEWRFSTSTSATDPGSGRFRFDNVVLASVTNLFLDDITNSGIDAGTLINALSIGDKIYVQQNDTAAKAVLLTVSGPPVDNTGWWTVPVTVDASGTLMDNNAKTAFVFFFGAGGASAQSVEDSGSEILASFTTLNFTDNLTVVDNGGGEAGISLSDNPIVGGTESITVPDGTTGERPGSPVDGMMRYNTTDNQFEFFQNGEWRTFSVGGTGPGSITGSIIGYHFLLDAKDVRGLWLGTTTKHIGSNESPYVMPFNTTLIGLTYTNGTSNTDLDFEIHRSADGAGTTTDIPFIWYVRGARTGRRTDMALDFSVGDKIGVFARAPSDQGFQIVNVGDVRVGGDATGLANDATVYTASISVDGGGGQAIAVTGSAAQTYTTLITELDLDTAGATWSIIRGNLVATSTSTGIASTISITDTDLFSSLTDFVAIEAAIRGGDLLGAVPTDVILSVLMQMADEIFVEVLENYVGDFVA